MEVKLYETFKNRGLTLWLAAALSGSLVIFGKLTHVLFNFYFCMNLSKNLFCLLAGDKIFSEHFSLSSSPLHLLSLQNVKQLFPKYFTFTFLWGTYNGHLALMRLNKTYFSLRLLPFSLRNQILFYFFFSADKYPEEALMK